MITQFRSRRKATGGRYIDFRKKRLRYKGSIPTLTRLAPKTTKILIRTRGNHQKVSLLTVSTANVYNPSTKKHQKVKIETVVDNPANRNYIRRNIITKGSIIKTELGNARITSRPAQDGIINAVLVK